MSSTPYIPNRLNILLGIIVPSIAVLLLWIASRVTHWYELLLIAIAFSYINNTVFSLLHEAVHGLFNTNPSLNNNFGRFFAAFFPTGFTMQRLFHLGHHKRNRTAAEQFDYYRETDYRFIKYLQWYGILTGLYWLLAPLTGLLYLLFPNLVHWLFQKSNESKFANETGTHGMLSSLKTAPKNLIRLELLFTLMVQLSLFFIFGISFKAWIICYAAFAINWSSLQYADHAWSELDIKNGAWNLKINKLVQWLFLNYHHHLAHHQHPYVSWLHLAKYVDLTKPRPRFVSIYLQMWLGPKPFPKKYEKN